MNFLQKLRFLFSWSDDLSWLPSLDYRDRFTQRVLRLVEQQPEPAWIDKLELRTKVTEESPTITVAQVHAELGSAIEQGYGDRPVAISLAFQEGLLCGKPSVKVSRVTRFDGRLANIYGPVHLETDRTAVLLDRSTFAAAMKHQEGADRD